MSSIYLLPVDPSALQVTPSAPSGVDPAKLWKQTPHAASKPPNVGTTHLFYGDNITALSSLGDKFAAKKGDQRREVVRKAVAGGIKKVRDLGESVDGSKVLLDASVDPHAVAVGAHLALYHFTLKTKPTSSFDPRLSEPLPDKLSLSPLSSSAEWDMGVVYAEAQNLARTVRVPDCLLQSFSCDTMLTSEPNR
ncbi:hypothetical protein C8Q74DRAFT_1371302 [Fomes fomentarius]|nr:hypothetical protein C8Q74DRAFT_1371302 [Fomes fomentarius]